ncbi:hypothetical protein J5Y09_08325 [Roseomonas sp. PWR1]|uniref:Outer membrane protein n=1 Tax=Roseomonas nitratireducens TaxID=2820810 RepID=A0ABS4ARC9_9PROT|nr:hypothetical protein [Neoroseomonas nitratireducens]MBP0463913.1 hypothetical protein [Neoroseomonas nitratireducens]
MKRNHWRLGAAATVLAVGIGTGAAARDTGLRPGWSFEVAPYAWLPSVDANLRYSLPPGIGGSADVKADAADYSAQFNFAMAVGATVRYDRFTLLTDIMYVSADAGASRVEGADIIGVGRNPISSSVNVSGSTNLKTTLWTLAAGYTLATGSWGNVDVLAGFRYLGVEATTDYNLAVTLLGPRGNAGPSFGGVGRVSGRDDIWNGIFGVRGRINIAQSGFFVPYYLDIGAGDSNLTWQTFAGIGYQSGWAGVQLGWRYMSYDQGRSSLVQDMTMSGAYLAVNFSF